MAESITTLGFDRLARARAIMLTTYRRSGEPVGTPVWLVVREGGIWATTTATSGKVKRIRYDPRLTVAPCTQTGRVTGPAQEGHARLMGREESDRALDAIRGRYGILDRIMSLLNRLQGETEEVGKEVTPEPSPREPPRQSGRT